MVWRREGESDHSFLTAFTSCPISQMGELMLGEAKSLPKGRFQIQICWMPKSLFIYLFICLFVCLGAALGL